MTPELYPEGIPIVFDHRRIIDFREEYRFQYETYSPEGCDENPTSGYSVKLDKDGKLLAQLASNRSSIRLTTAALRFRPSDFPMMTLQATVTKNVKGADPVKGGSGADDSAFQIWFTLRRLNGVADRREAREGEVLLFGYYWGDPSISRKQKAGDLFENYYSEKGYYVTQLPEGDAAPSLAKHGAYLSQF